MLTSSFIDVRLFFRYTCILNLNKLKHHQNTTTLTEFDGGNDLSIDCVFFLFASIILLCFIYANWLLHCHYYCITMCYSRISNIYRDKPIIRTYKQQQHWTVGNIYRFNVYFFICLHPYYWFVFFMLIYPIVVIIVLQHFRHVYWKNFTQHHNTAAEITT